MGELLMRDYLWKQPDKKMNENSKKYNFIINNSKINYLIITSYKQEYLIFFINRYIIVINQQNNLLAS